MTTDLLRLETKVDRNTGDIQSLTNQVTRIATMVETAEKRHGEDIITLRGAIETITRLNDKIAAAVNIEKDVSNISKEISELKGEVRVVKHDMNNLSQQTAGYAAIFGNMRELSVKVENLEQWRDKATGGASVIKHAGILFWGVFGTGIIALAAYLLKSFFTGG